MKMDPQMSAIIAGGSYFAGFMTAWLLAWFRIKQLKGSIAEFLMLDERAKERGNDVKQKYLVEKAVEYAKRILYR